MAILGRFKRSKTNRQDQPPVDDRPRVTDLTVGEYANGMPNIRIGQMLKSFARQLPWMIPLMLIGMMGAWMLTDDFKRTYQGEGSILVQVGPEYVYESVTSQQTAGLLLTPDHIVLNEIGIMKNSEVIEQVAGEMESKYGERFSPSTYKERVSAHNRGDVKAGQDATVDLYRQMENSFMVAAQPKSSLVHMAYKHEDGEIAVDTLNAFIDAYLSYRRTVFVEGSGDLISERRIATEQQLQQNERAINRFLKNNRISDYTSEREGVQKRTEELRATLNKLRGDMAETEAALATVEGQLRNLPPQINLYVDDRASQRVAQAELELKQLLAKYLPGSDPVRQKQTEIAELKSLQSSYGGKAQGGRRVGPNPVFQELMTRRNILQSTADSYREKEYTLQRQLNSADAKVQRLQELNPSYQSLLRERDTLDSRLKSYTSKEQEALVNQQQAEASSENVRIISRASLPRKGRNMRMIAFALATLGWGFTLFMLALLRVFLDPRLYSTPGPRSRYAAPVPELDIPEPVAPYMPTESPAAPAHAPAVATHGYEPQPKHAPVEQYAQADAYGQMQAEPVHSPATTTAYMGNTATAYDLHGNPYLSGAQAGALQPNAMPQAETHAQETPQADHGPQLLFQHDAETDGRPSGRPSILGVVPSSDQD